MTTILISSTCHDLGDLRDFLDYELTRHGFVTVLSDKGTVPVKCDRHSYENCLDAARSCDITLGVIGGRFGGKYPGTDKSITQMEIEEAIGAGKHVLVVARHGVLTAKEILRPYSKDGIPFRPSKVVEDERVFSVLDEITKLKTGNWIHGFERPREILEYLAVQLKFDLLPVAPEGADRLDHIVATRLIEAFPPGLVEAVYRGLQIGTLQAADMDNLEYGWHMLLPDHVRFRDSDCATVFDRFMDATAWVLSESPNLFRTAINPEVYVDRYPGDVVPYPEVTKMREKLIGHGEAMRRSWTELVDRIRDRFPCVLAAILEGQK